MTLITKPVNRIFTFGCSFTGYHWLVWPEILSYELQAPLYNYGRSGAGNQFIFNSLIQANKFYKFDENDLVIVCWTNVFREDRFINNKWILTGNMMYSNFYSEDYKKKYADMTGYLVRDLAAIDSTDIVLQNSKCQYHFLSMNDIAYQYNQYNTDTIDTPVSTKLIDLYRDTLSKVLPSFYQTLWNNDFYNKIEQERELFKFKNQFPKFADGHPSPIEHLEYLQKVFNYTFKKDTVDSVNEIQEQWVNILSAMLINNQKRLTRELNLIETKIRKLVRAEPICLI